LIASLSVDLDRTMSNDLNIELLGDLEIYKFPVIPLSLGCMHHGKRNISTLELFIVSKNPFIPLP